jgi:hypothetical protein
MDKISMRNLAFIEGDKAMYEKVFQKFLADEN